MLCVSVLYHVLMLYVVEWYTPICWFGVVQTVPHQFMAGATASRIRVRTYLYRISAFMSGRQFRL